MFLPEGRNKKVYTQDGQIKTKCWCMYRGIQSWSAVALQRWMDLYSSVICLHV
jgi:hypothetical protein